VQKALLAVGFLALAVGIAAANAKPATGYELSIYRATPPLFWVGVGIALAASLYVSFSAVGRLRGLALALGGTAVFAIVLLPLIRDYAFYGSADPLTHLGWTRDMVAGTLNSLGLFYPGVHTVAAFLDLGAGVALTRSLMLASLAFALAFLLFVPLTVRAITGSGTATAIGAFSAFAFLPVNHVATHMRTHPYTQMLLFTPVLLFILVVYLTSDDGLGRTLAVTPIGVLMAAVSIGIVLYHPQQAVNLVLVFAAICVTQYVARRWWHRADIARHRSLYFQTVVFAVATALWIYRKPRFVISTENVFAGFVGFLGGTTHAGAQLGSSGAALTAIGAGLPVLFLKLFLVSAIYVGLAALVAGSSVFERFRWSGMADDERAIVTYLAVGVVAISPLFVVYLLGNIERQYFRHLGAIMVFVTVLGAIGLYHLARRGTPRLGDVLTPRRRAVVVLALVVLLPLALATVYQSPYIYKESQGITQSQFEGYGTVFDHHDVDVQLLGVRGGPWRYSDAVQGFQESSYYHVGVTGSEMTHLASSVNRSAELVVTTYDRERELDAYRGLRYTAGDFASLETQRRVDRVQSNGEVTLYYTSGS